MTTTTLQGGYLHNGLQLGLTMKIKITATRHVVEQVTMVVDVPDDKGKLLMSDAMKQERSFWGQQTIALRDGRAHPWTRVATRGLYPPTEIKIEETTD
jgi:hypothetical protein